jgi:GNAT superfamily N-acetyltransferase
MDSDNPVNLSFHPLTAERWDDFKALFDQPGEPRQCWCMGWRLRSTDYNALSYAEREAAMQALVQADTPVGVLAYAGDKAVGWCSVAPRESYVRLMRSKTYPAIDEQPTWTVMCFFIDKRMRGQQLALPLLRAAVHYAVSQGASIVEGYPVESQYNAKGKLIRDYSAYMGTLRVFEDAGFKKAAVNEKGRKIMRYTVQ